MDNSIVVGLGEVAVSKDPGAVLVALGLGSCVGICAYDPVSKVGGMLHAMLPKARTTDKNPAKFVDTGVEELIERLIAAGARKERLVWRMAGGAQMLAAPGLTDRFNIGSQNVAAALDIFNRQRFHVLGADAGGNQGRTVRLFVDSGRVAVRKVNGEERWL